jgi:hypothetical protein
LADPKKKTDNTFLKEEVNPKDFKVIFIYKKPIYSRVSRGGLQACINIDGNPHRHKVDLKEFVDQGEDTMKYYEHFKNYTEESDKNYSVICINYHKLWDNLADILYALNIPKEEIYNFPKRNEAKREISEDLSTGLYNIYRELCEQIDDMPPVKIVKNKEL